MFSLSHLSLPHQLSPLRQLSLSHSYPLCVAMAASTALLVRFSGASAFLSLRISLAPPPCLVFLDAALRIAFVGCSLLRLLRLWVFPPFIWLLLMGFAGSPQQGNVASQVSLQRSNVDGPASSWSPAGLSVRRHASLGFSFSSFGASCKQLRLESASGVCRKQFAVRAAQVRAACVSGFLGSFWTLCGFLLTARLNTIFLAMSSFSSFFCCF